MPFPATLEAARFVIGQIRDAYQVAKDAPGVLAQQLCQLNKLAAQKVTVKGTISGNTITVASIAPASKEKKSHIPSGN